MSRFKTRTHFEADRVYLEDIRSSRLFYCPDLIKFFTRHGLDYRDFKHNGIAFSALEATGDQMAIDAINNAKNRGVK